MAYGQRRHRRQRASGRLPLARLGVTGAGLAAVAVIAVIGVGQLTSGQTTCGTSARSTAALSLAALSEQSGTVSGIATHYVLTGLPNCSYPSPPANGLFVALPPAEYDSAAACGGYLTVTGPDGSVTVRVIDQCPDCATGHIDLSEPAFADIAPLSAGLVNVRFQSLTDPPLSGPITLEVKAGSNPYWLALLAGNTGNPLASVQVETASGGWISLVRASYNYWLATSGEGAGPFTVRLTDIEGNQVTLRNVALDPGAVQSTGVWMYGPGHDQAVPSAAASASGGSAAASPSASPARKKQPPVPAAPAARPTATPTPPRSPTPATTC